MRTSQSDPSHCHPQDVSMRHNVWLRIGQSTESHAEQSDRAQFVRGEGKGAPSGGAHASWAAGQQPQARSSQTECATSGTVAAARHFRYAHQVADASCVRNTKRRVGKYKHALVTRNVTSTPRPRSDNRASMLYNSMHVRVSYSRPRADRTTAEQGSMLYNDMFEQNARHRDGIDRSTFTVAGRRQAAR